MTTRYHGWYANRPRGMRRQAEPAAAGAPPAIGSAPRLAPTEATRRWAALLQQIVEVDPLACPACHGTMRVVACITQASVIDQILRHLRNRNSYPDLHQRTLAIHTIDATGTLVRKANLYLEYISEGRVGQLDDLNHRDGQVGLTDVKSANDFSGTRASWRTRQIGNVVAVEDDSKNRGHDPHGNDVRRCRATGVALRGFK